MMLSDYTRKEKLVFDFELKLSTSLNEALQFHKTPDVLLEAHLFLKLTNFA